MDNATQKRRIRVGRQDMHTIRLDPHALFDVYDFHAGTPLQQFAQGAFLRRVLMLDDNKGKTAVIGHVAKKFFQRLQPARRCANTDDRADSGLALTFHFRPGCRLRERYLLRLAILFRRLAFHSRLLFRSLRTVALKPFG